MECSSLGDKRNVVFDNVLIQCRVWQWQCISTFNQWKKCNFCLVRLGDNVIFVIFDNVCIMHLILKPGDLTIYLYTSWLI